MITCILAGTLALPQSLYPGTCTRRGAALREGRGSSGNEENDMDGKGNSHVHGGSFANGETGAGSGLPAVARKNWELMLHVLNPQARTTIYDFM